MKNISKNALLSLLCAASAICPVGCGGSSEKAGAAASVSVSTPGASSPGSSSEAPGADSSFSAGSAAAPPASDAPESFSESSTDNSSGTSSGISSGISSGTSTGSSSGSADSSAPSVEDDNITAEMSGTVLVLSTGRGMACFYGAEYQAESYAAYVNKFKSLAGDIRVYTLTAPTAGSFYCPQKYLDIYGIRSEKVFADQIAQRLENVVSVDAYSALDAHSSENIYFATDHHWSQLGAYYAGEAFAKAAEVPFAPLSEYEEVSEDGYIGSFYMYSDYDPRIGGSPESFTYYKPSAKYTTVDYTYGDFDLAGGWDSDIIVEWNDWYMIFGMDNIIRRVTTEADTGRRLLIIKDSYGNAMVPSLVSSFDEIFVTDLRYFSGSVVSFAKKNGITDVLFVMDSFSAAGSGGYFQSIIY